MSYKYTHFIKQNIAPKGATKIIIYNSMGEEVTDIPLGGLTPPNTQNKKYSFGLLSDTHLHKNDQFLNALANDKFEKALSYVESQGCNFCAISGDITNTGFYNDGDAVNKDYRHFEKYNDICGNHNIDVYPICGNHESYEVSIKNDIDQFRAYTGCDLYYTIERENDVFIFVGQEQETIPMGEDIKDDNYRNAVLRWLYGELEKYRNKRCFLFVHPHISSGNASNAYRNNKIFQDWRHFELFKKLLAHYKNVIVFHGHSHFKLECQELDKTANYTEKDGFKSVHVPSVGQLKQIINDSRENDYGEAQCYIVDVYEDFIVLNGVSFSGVNFNDIKPIPLGTYKINTALQAIRANTFKDSTGIITT